MDLWIPCICFDILDEISAQNFRIAELRTERYIIACATTQTAPAGNRYPVTLGYGCDGANHCVYRHKEIIESER